MEPTKYSTLSLQEETVGKEIVNAAFIVHKTLGPGLLEKVYEACIAHELNKVGLKVVRQVDIPITYDGIIFKEGLRLDLLVDDRAIVEIKALDNVNPVWQAQILSNLKLTGKRLGYLINFNVPIIRQGIRRFVL